MGHIHDRVFSLRGIGRVFWARQPGVSVTLHNRYFAEVRQDGALWKGTVARANARDQVVTIFTARDMRACEGLVASYIAEASTRVI